MPHGQERRQLKKKLCDLQRFVKMFWFYEDTERIYGGGNSDKKCDEMLNTAKARIKELEEILSE